MKNRLSFVVALCLLPLSVSAQYRCVENGKTIFTDSPCANAEPLPDAGKPGKGPKVIGDAGNSAYATPNGSWRGQVQFQGTGPGGVIQEAMAVVPVTLDIEAQGKVVGSSPENGCRLMGIASPGLTPRMLNLDITLSGCRYRSFNRRFFGSLIVDQEKKVAQLSLSGVYRVFVDTTHADLRGSLRR